ncbi:DUF3566 domain-containing protein [Auraticoccus monumenti]|uniref:DUF3566 domain-containing protein n=1 Tax=Auraticoccus monumenti TaxID=675864 RepID=A0A1G6U5R8_9ACTN|nr:DUF3566 domain-containing protein [Auraticoccus monumenti]SDD35875.1 Transmembrane protein of unknown function [Auraticoccus monumenti]
MSDRTEVTDPAVTPADGQAGGRPADQAGSDAAGPTRADRVMGRVRDGGRGQAGANGQPGPSDQPGTSGSQETTPGQPSQRATAVPGASRTGSAPERPGSRPRDGWGRGATSGPGSSPVEDDSPTRVNPAVATPSGRGADRSDGRAATGAVTPTGTATGALGTSTEDEASRTIAGTGALGAVTGSMEEPTQPVPTAGGGTAATEAGTSTRETLAPPTRATSKSSRRKSRRARLRLSRIDPWSVMKTSFLFSIALGIAGWVLVAFVWWVIQQSGLFGAVNTIVADMFSAPGDADPFRLEAYVNGSRVLGLTALLAVVDVLLITAISTVASFLYNLSATMLGGLQVTLAETDD